jgi:hypothetical protein
VEWGAQSSRLTALSALAEGADTVFARAAVEAGVPLDAVLPHRAYASNFTTPEALAEYQRLCSLSRARRVMPYAQASDEAYQAAMRWITDTSDLLVAVWDRAARSAVGGTADAVAYGRARRRRILHIDPLRLTVSGG